MLISFTLLCPFTSTGPLPWGCLNFRTPDKVPDGTKYTQQRQHKLIRASFPRGSRMEAETWIMRGRQPSEVERSFHTEKPQVHRPWREREEPGGFWRAIRNLVRIELRAQGRRGKRWGWRIMPSVPFFLLPWNSSLASTHSNVCDC